VLQLGKLEAAMDIAKGSESEQKWKQLSDLALTNGRFDIAEQCMANAEDLSGLLLLYSSFGDAKGMERLAKLAIEKGAPLFSFFFSHFFFFCCFVLLGV
jgi:coatomer subunit beta'